MLSCLLEPVIILDDPDPGALVASGCPYEITWFDYDTNYDASIALLWDADTDFDNNTPETSGIGWGPIADGISEDDETDAYSWVVDAPAGGVFHLGATIEDAEDSSYNYTERTFQVREASNGLIQAAAHTYPNGVTVSFYDVDSSDGVTVPNVAWSRSEYEEGVTDVLVTLGRGAAVSSITFMDGGGGSDDLGVVVEGCSLLDRLTDVRAVSEALGFLACEGSVRMFKWGSGVIGADLNGFTAEGGWTLPADADEDGDADDPVALYVAGSLRNADLGNYMGGDVVVTGVLGDMRMRDGDLEGDVRASAINTLFLQDGDLLGDARATGGGIGRLMLQDGSVRGDLISVAGNLNLLSVRHGDIESGIQVAGRLGRVLVADGDVSGASIQVRDLSILIADAVTSDSVTATGRIGMLVARSGSVTSTIDAAGELRRLWAVRGEVSGAGITVGGLGMVVAGSITAGDITSGGNIVGLVSKSGDITSSVEADGTIRTINAAGGIGGAAISACDIRTMIARGGNIACDVTTTGDVQMIRASGGDLAGDVQVGGALGYVGASGTWGIGGNVSGDISAAGALGRIVVQGDLTGNVSAGSGIARVLVYGDVDGAQIATAAGDAPFLRVGGRIRDCTINVGGLLKTVQVGGDLLDTSIEAGELDRVEVKGQIATTGADRIHALRGVFTAADADESVTVGVDGCDCYVFSGGVEASVG